MIDSKFVMNCRLCNTEPSETVCVH